MGGTISGGANQLNNIVIGTTSPLAITGTTITANTSISSPIHTAAGKHTFQSNGSTFAGSISTGQLWFFGATDLAPAGGSPVITVSKNAAATAQAGSLTPVATFVDVDATNTGGVVIQNFGTNTPAALRIVGAAGTGATPTSIQTGNQIGINFVYGYCSACTPTVQPVAGFVAVSTDNFTATTLGTRLDLYSTATGSASVGAKVSVGAGMMVGTTTNDPGAGGIRATGATIQFTALASDAAQTDNTVCVNSSGTLLKGSGTIGICLGTSSERYKTDVVDLVDGIDEIMKLRSVNFHYKKDIGHDPSKIQFGFTAEQVFNIIPALVDVDSQGRPNTVDIVGMIPIIVRSIQKLKAENDNLNEEISKMKRVK